MIRPRIHLLLGAFALGAAAFAGEPAKKVAVPPETDRWNLLLASPGWLAGLEGDVGIDGVVSRVEVDPGDIIRRIDMAASLRAEASKGRFGIMGDFLYLSLSDGIGTNTAVKKLDLQVDEVLAELAVRWRLIDSPRGSLDLYGGVRYTNLHQQLVLQANAQQIDESSERLVDAVGSALRTALSDSQLGELIGTHLSARVPTFDPGQPLTLPIGPLGGRVGDRLRTRVAEIVAAKQAELSAAVRAAQAAVGAARVAAQARVDDLKRDLSRKIAKAVESDLDTRVARTDDWWDPFIGLRARYDFNDRFYFTAKGDIGGFGLGADFTWQAEAAFGCHLTERIFAEAGYRALGVDYEDDGLIYDVVTHGAQVTLGITF